MISTLYQNAVKSDELTVSLIYERFIRDQNSLSQIK
jgi:hypothetical protein